MSTSLSNSGSPAKTGMNCPVCSVGLVMSERQTIEIDYCPQCRGVWLDRGELDKIIDYSFQQFGAPEEAMAENPDAGEYGRAGSYDNGGAPQGRGGYAPEPAYREQEMFGYGAGEHGGEFRGKHRGKHGDKHGGKHGRSGHGNSKNGGGGYGARSGNRTGGQLSWLKDLFD